MSYDIVTYTVVVNNLVTKMSKTVTKQLKILYIIDRQEFLEYTYQSYINEFNKEDEIERLSKINSRPLSKNTQFIENALSVSYDGLII